MSKWHNVKTTYKGLCFDSIAECNRYKELEVLFEAGQINWLSNQPKLRLLDGFTAKLNGCTQKIRPIDYIADFKYLQDGHWVYEDVKGKMTPEFRLKMKLLLKQYPGIDFRLLYTEKKKKR